MSKPFSEEERKWIEEQLFDAAKECLHKYGVKKTTVDKIVEIAGISKGSFYNFYSRKEILFFRVFEEYQKTLMDEFKQQLENEEKIDANKFSELVYSLFQNFRESFIMNIIQNQEMELLIAKLPKEELANHHSLAESIMESILSRVEVKEDISADVISASLRALVMSMLHIKEVGEEEFDDVLKILIKGLSQQMIKEGS